MSENCQLISTVQTYSEPDRHSHVPNRLAFLINVYRKGHCGHSHIKPALLGEFLQDLVAVLPRSASQDDM
jgi:hypothetical protein